MEQDIFERVTTGKMPNSLVVFLDEIFKCNPPTLNVLLPMLERKRMFYDNDEQGRSIPCLFFGCASNEMPEGGANGELAPLWDRLHIRLVTSYIKNVRNFGDMWQADDTFSPTTSIDIGDFMKWQKDVCNVQISHLRPTMENLWKMLEKEGFSISDRRFKESKRFLQAHAFLEGKTSCDENDLIVLTHMLWDEPEQIKAINKIVMSFSNPATVRANEIYDASVEMMSKLRGMSDGQEKSAYATEANHKMKLAYNQLKNLSTDAKSGGKSTTLIDKMMSEVKSFNNEVVKDLLGI
jgi:MoxR-like ATPase